MQQPAPTSAHKDSVPAPSSTDLAINEIVIDVYESSEATEKRRMLNLLVGRAYETAPPVVRKSLLEHLLRPMGLLGLISVAGGTFAKFRLQQNGWQDPSIGIEDLRDIRSSDVIALVDYVQQLSISAIVEAITMLSNAAALTGSGAVAVLATLVLRRSIERRKMARE